MREAKRKYILGQAWPALLSHPILAPLPFLGPQPYVLHSPLFLRPQGRQVCHPPGLGPPQESQDHWGGFEQPDQGGPWVHPLAGPSDVLPQLSTLRSPPPTPEEAAVTRLPLAAPHHQQVSAGTFPTLLE